MAIGLQAKSLVLKMNNGNEIYYLLGGEKNPNMTFDEGNVIVNADNYEISGIKSFYISNDNPPDGIEQVFKSTTSFEGNILSIEARKAKEVKVYTIDGRKITPDVMVSGDKAYVDLNTLDKGAYIINIGSSSLKIRKK